MSADRGHRHARSAQGSARAGTPRRGLRATLAPDRAASPLACLATYGASRLQGPGDTDVGDGSTRRSGQSDRGQPPGTAQNRTEVDPLVRVGLTLFVIVMWILCSGLFLLALSYLCTFILVLCVDWIIVCELYTSVNIQGQRSTQASSNKYPSSR